MAVVGVIGAGAAGIMAALAAAEEGARVVLFDTNRTVGRKLAVTGNGRGNLTNLGACVQDYRCADDRVVEAVLAAFTPKDLLAYLGRLGVLTYATEDGWCYPVSESAVAVVDLLAAALELADVETRLLTKVDGLDREGGRWNIRHSGGSARVTADSVVLATGGLAAPALGATGSLYPALESLGITVLPGRPALVPLVGDVRRLHKLQGVRLDVSLRLLRDGVEIGYDQGNLMFTQNGLSGPAAMNLSHLVSQPAGVGLEAAIDLAPIQGEALSDLLGCYAGTGMPLAVLLGAVVPPKVPPVLLSLYGLPPETRMDELAAGAVERVVGLLHDLRVPITGTRGFQHAQLSAGGVPVTEVRAPAMESRQCPRLHLAGEVLDVVGPCGGYNLQWAFASGRLAGLAAAGG